MTILSRVRAEFRNRKGEVIFSIRREDVMTVMTNVPEEIQEDPMFGWMIKDGSLDVVDNITQQKKLELDPKAGTSADGKKIVPETAPETAERKPARTRKAKKEAEPAEDKPEEAKAE